MHAEITCTGLLFDSLSLPVLSRVPASQSRPLVPEPAREPPRKFANPVHNRFKSFLKKITLTPSSLCIIYAYFMWLTGARQNDTQSTLVIRKTTMLTRGITLLRTITFSPDEVQYSYKVAAYFLHYFLHTLTRFPILKCDKRCNYFMWKSDIC